MGVGVCLVIFYYSCVVVYESFHRGVIDIQSVDVPQWIILIILPITFFMLTIQFIINLVGKIKETRG